MAEDRFKILFDNSADAHMIVGPDGITDCNDAMIRLLKCRKKEEVLSIHPARLSPERQPDGQLSSEKSKEMDALARANGFHRFEWIHQKLDGENFPVQVTMNAVEIGGKPCLIAVWHDLTEAKLAEKQIRDLNARMSHELQSAAEFQRSLLPAAAPDTEQYGSAWFYKPCEELGGDSLGVFKIDDTHLGLYVLDVTGHGVASALLSVTATHCMSGFFKLGCPTEVVGGLNRHFFKERFANHSFTLVYGVLDLKDLTLAYTSAGHVGPIRVKKDGTVEQYESLGIPIGMIAEAEYSLGKIRLEKGDRIFLISDGIYEARNVNKEDLGLARVHAHLKNENHNGYSLEYTVNSLARTAYHWCIPEKPDDDISVVGLEIK